MKDKILYSAIILVALGLMMMVFNNKDENRYTDELKEVKLNELNRIYNKTEVSSLDTIYQKGLEILNIKNETFLIVDINDSNFNKGFGEDFRIQGTVTKRPGNYYAIHTKVDDNKNMIKIASHELIHIKQMVDNNLTYNNDGVTFNNRFYKIPFKLKYRQLPWEKEAYKKAPDLLNKMRDSLLIKK